MINIFFWPDEKSVDILLETGFVFRTEFYKEAVHPWREHYLHFISLEWFEGRCDVFANSLAILLGVADGEKRVRILKYFDKKKLSDPYPIKVLNPPVWISSYVWNPKIDLYRLPQQKNLPFCYHNAGIWPWAGGFYVLLLAKVGKRKKARKELEKLAEANRIGMERRWEFNEWLHGKSGEPRGAILQSWSAAGYIIAYKAVVEKEFSI
jgi:glycogen debranching enzyme